MIRRIKLRQRRARGPTVGDFRGIAGTLALPFTLEEAGVAARNRLPQPGQESRNRPWMPVEASSRSVAQSGQRRSCVIPALAVWPIACLLVP